MKYISIELFFKRPHLADDKCAPPKWEKMEAVISITINKERRKIGRKEGRKKRGREGKRKEGKESENLYQSSATFL